MALGSASLLPDLTLVNGLLRDAPHLDADVLEAHVEGYSRAIQQYLEREFKPATAAAARKFRYDGHGVLDLAPYELTAVTAVTLYTDTPSPDTLENGDASTESDYRLEPRNGTAEGTYTWLALPEVPETPRRRRLGVEVTVTGDWGAGTAPADVQLVCARLAAAAWRNPEGFESRQLGELQFTEDVAPGEEYGLPRSARRALARYRRPRFGA